MIEEIELHMWRLQVSVQAEQAFRNRTNIWPLVLGATITEAISVVQEKYPGCTVWGVQHITGPKKNEYDHNPVLQRK